MSDSRSRLNVIGFAASALLALAVALVFLRVATRPATPRARVSPPPSPRAVVEAASASPKATPTPRPAKLVRFVWQHSGAAATGIAWVTGGGSLPIPDGTIARDALAGAGEIADPESGLALATVADGAALPDTVRLAEPIRLTVSTNVAADRVRLGFGPAERPMTRIRREAGSHVSPAPDEDAPWGFELEGLPAHWRDMERQPDGTWISPWFLATDPPAAVATTSKGAFGRLAVDVPGDLAPRATLDAGVLTLHEPAALAVTIDLPESEVAANIILGFSEGSIAEADRELANGILSALDRVDRRVAEFALRQGNIFVAEAGEHLIAPLPPMERAVFFAQGVTPDKVAFREIALRSGETTRVRFTVEELFPADEGSFAVDGRLILEGTGDPVEGARLVASSYRRREEAATDAAGRFRFEAIPVNRELAIFIEAFDVAEPPRFSHTRTIQLPRLEPPGHGEELVWEIPALRWLIVEGDLGPVRHESGLAYVALQVRAEDGSWGYVDDVGDINAADWGAEIELSRPGTYRAVVAEGPFSSRFSGTAEFGRDDWERTVRLEAAAPGRDQLTLSIISAEGEPVAGATVLVGGPFPGMDPVSLVSDAAGRAVIRDVNVPEVEVLVHDERGDFAGRVRVPGTGDATVRLKSPELAE